MLVERNLKYANDYFSKMCEENMAYFVYAVVTHTDDKNYKHYMLNLSGGHTVYEVDSQYFEIIDDSLPKDWVKTKYTAYGKLVMINTFPEWANNKYFYAELMDGEPRVIEVLSRYTKAYEKIASDWNNART